LRERFDLSDLQEVTIESNPGTFSAQDLDNFKQLGINRISIGVQTLDEDILAVVNRPQRNEDVLQAIKLAYSRFDNVSVDLILGLPGITTDIWFNTLKTLCNLDIKHISIYFLTLYPGTVLTEQIECGDLTIPSSEWMADCYKKTVQTLKKKKFCQYEISNFSIPGYESSHNKAYWDCKNYLGFGVAAASFCGNIRSVNTRCVSEYIDFWQKNLVGRGTRPTSSEIISKKESFLEKIMLEARQSKGIDLRGVLYYLGVRQGEELIKRIEMLESRKLLFRNGGRVVLTHDGMMLENEVILYLTEDFF
jgi:oxygen-independent coproporphyrinogen III oxidase